MSDLDKIKELEALLQAIVDAYQNDTPMLEALINAQNYLESSK